eukprot:7127839-Pyramimonas_sp.AAC.1
MRMESTGCEEMIGEGSSRSCASPSLVASAWRTCAARRGPVARALRPRARRLRLPALCCSSFLLRS